MSYQAGEFLETCKDNLLNGCKIIIEKCRVDSSKRKYVVCKKVEKGDWSGFVDYNPANKKRFWNIRVWLYEGLVELNVVGT